MAEKCAGTCYVTVDGRQLTVGGTVTISATLKVREGIAGLNAPAGYSEKARIPSIEVEVITTPRFRLKDFTGLTDGTVQANLANGRQYVLTHAYQAGEPEVDAAEGKVTLRFEGTDCSET